MVFGGLWATLGGSGLMLRVRVVSGSCGLGWGLLCVGVLWGWVKRVTFLGGGGLSFLF